MASDHQTTVGHHSQSQGVTLKRSLGIPSGVALLVGSIIGSGIFATPKWVLIFSGSVGLCLIVWVLGGLISLLGALCFLELGLLIPKCGGEYQYLLAAFGALPGFLFAWMSLLERSLAGAIIMFIFSSYIIEPFFPGCSSREDLLPLNKILGVAALSFIVLVNCASVKWASRVQIIFTVAKMAAIIMLILTGIVRLAQGHTTSFIEPFKGTEPKVDVVGFAFYSVMFSYEGWNNINYTMEELKNPKRNFPIIIWIAITIVTISYVLVNVGYLAVLSPDEVVKSNAVAVTLGNRIYGVMAWVMPFFVACSVFGAVNGGVFASGRLIFAAAREGHLPKLLAMIHKKQRTPIPSLLFIYFFTIICMVPEAASINSLLSAFAVVVWLIYGSTLCALLWLRIKRRNAPRPYKVFIGFPCLLILLSIYLVVAAFIRAPIGSLIVLGYILAGIPVYFILVHFKLVPTACLDRMTSFLQDVLNVVFPESEAELM